MTRATAVPVRDVNDRWLTTIPAHWHTSRLRFVCRIETGSADTVDADESGAFPFIVRSGTPLRASTFSYDAEAILTAGDGAVGEIFHHLKGKFLAHQRVYVLTEFREVNPRLLFYYFSSFFRLMAMDGSAKTTVDSVRRWMLTDMPVVLPPVPEQAVIADYLDRETAQIDTLIAKQEQLIATLRERRTGVQEAEFAPHVGHGDRLRWHVTEVDNRAGNLADSLPLLSVSITWGVKRRSITGLDKGRADDLSRYKVTRAGDIVINRMRAFQGALGVAPCDGVVSPDYAVLHCGAAVHADWLSLVMRSQIFVGQMISRLKGIGTTEGGTVRTPRINVEELLDIQVNVPELRQQEAERAIASRAIGKIDTLIAKAERFIELSKERRAALITAAVTGQIDIPA